MHLAQTARAEEGEDEDAGLGDPEEDGPFPMTEERGGEDVEGHGVEATLEGAEGRRLRVFTWRFRRQGQSSGEGWGGPPGGVTILGRPDGFLEV